jgi:hypothetical protein
MKHPAVIAFGNLKKKLIEPAEVEILKEERGRSVYRLRKIALSGSNVIAKRCRIDEAERERIIYETILQQLPFPTVRYYGFLEVGDGKQAWLFIEDIGDEITYSPLISEHRTLAGQWLGLLHISRLRLTETARLRDRGPDHFFEEHLKAICRIIPQNLSNPALEEDDLIILKTIISKIDLIASHWRNLKSFCDQMPQTFVHGDFKEVHMYLRYETSGIHMLAIDWNEAGWGVTALDVAKFLGYAVAPDINAYCSIVQDRWPFMDFPTIYRLGYVGEVFRCLASIRWEAEKLKYEWVKGPMKTLDLYNGWLDEIIKAEPWAAQAKSGFEARLPKHRGWN